MKILSYEIKIFKVKENSSWVDLEDYFLRLFLHKYIKKD